MSVNEEFLDNLLDKLYSDLFNELNNSLTLKVGGVGRRAKTAGEIKEEAREAILQHFQQEQESLMVKGAEAFRDQLSIAFMFRSEKVMETIDEELQGYKHFLRGGKGGK